MKIKSLFINFLIVVISLLFLEIVSSLIVFYKEKKVGILLSPFKAVRFYQTKFVINWDNKTKKVIPGTYVQKNKKGKLVTYNINSKGFRGKEFNEEKTSSNRIISFGGSTTMGLSSPDNLTYPSILESIIKEKNYDIEVLNFGLSSKSLNFIRELFYSEAIDYKPDIITIYSNRNPALYDSTGAKIKPNNKNSYIKKINTLLANNIMSFRILFKLYNKVLSIGVKSDKIISPYNNKIEHNIYYFEEQYKNTLEEIIVESRINSIKVILIKQAIFYDPEIQQKLEEKNIPELVKILKNLKQNEISGLNYNKSFWIVTNVLLNKQLDTLKHHSNVIVVDPTEKLIQSRENFYDNIHLSEKGNDIIAQTIYNSIKDHLK